MQKKQKNQGQMQLHVDVFAGLGMSTIAALSQPVMPYAGLDKLHVLNALQSAYQTAYNKSEADEKGV